jgi:hypothetical protein
MKQKKSASIPFEFVLEQLFPVNPVVRPMFGCHAIYVGDKMVMMLRNRDDHTEDNGVWVAVMEEHQESVRKELPSLRTVQLFGAMKTLWQNLPMDGASFEEEVMKACDLVLKKDKRIGKVPGQKKKKGKTGKSRT